jgi:hypothetical protein
MPLARARHLGLLLALLLSALLVGYQDRRTRVGYTRLDLPSFDAYVYMTMADEPAFFTAAPWGYRVLGPRLVHLLPPRARLRGFHDLSVGCLVASGGVLFLFLRRLGHGLAMALVGVAMLQLSRPVQLALGIPLLGDPLSLLLLLLALLASAGGAGALALAALLAAGVLTKELFLLLPPLLLFARPAGRGFGRALRAALLVGLPALLVASMLRFHWTPYLRVPRPPWNLELLRVAAESLREQWGETARALLLAGLAPLALLGALLREARPYLKRYGWLALLCVALALAAWLNVPSPAPLVLLGANTERLLIYALPTLIPLALLALERLLRVPRAVLPAQGEPPELLRGAALVGIALALSLPLLGVDRYRRLPLHERRDGPLLMAFCRESLRTARRLERGEEVLLEPERLRFAWGVSDPGGLFEMRWFLRDGWGPLPHYGVHDVRMREARASLVLPCLRPRAIQVTLELEAEQPVASLELHVNGSAVFRTSLAAGRAPLRFDVPAAALFRGDNLLTLSAADGAPAGLRLRSFGLRAAS